MRIGYLAKAEESLRSRARRLGISATVIAGGLGASLALFHWASPIH